MRTRGRILAAARRLFRRHGYAGVGVDKIMSAAGLTAGGFYRHFRSKSALFAAALEGEHDFVVRMAARPGGSRRRLSEQGLEVVRAYLAPENRDRVGRGCSLAALALDTARADSPARRAYAKAVRDLAAEFARGLDDAEPDDARGLVSIALCVGGLSLSRAVGDPELARAISEACGNAVARELGLSPDL